MPDPTPRDSIVQQAGAFRLSANQLRSEAKQKLAQADQFDAKATLWEAAAERLKEPQPVTP